MHRVCSSRNLIHVANDIRLTTIQLVPLSDAALIRRLPQPIDTSKWPVCVETIPWVQLHMIFPENPSVGVECVLALW